MKNKATRDWYEFLDRAEQKQYRWMTRGEHVDDISLERWKKFGNNVVNYMNGEDWFEHWHEFIDYMRPQDRYHKTNILDVYPEFEPYWEK